MKRKVLPIRKVALGLDPSTVFGGRLMEGIFSYAREHPHWQFARDGFYPCLPFEKLRRWKGDGIITFLHGDERTRLFTKRGIPVVNVSSARLSPGLPTVRCDNQLIGKVAARHLVGKGFERFAYVGFDGELDRQRLEGFMTELAENGFVPRVFLKKRSGRKNDPATLRRSINGHCRTLRELTLPVAIMAGTDWEGVCVMEACRELGLRSPDQVALIGCDNEEALCVTAHVPLTSVDPGAFRIGYEAAAMLETLMKGELGVGRCVLIPPDHIECRDSTDVQTISDPNVASVLRYIRSHAGKCIGVSDLLRVVPVSRRSLERRFQETRGYGVAEEIRRVHIARAKQLLEETDLSLAEVALRSGFSCVARFAINFQRQVGTSAFEYRKRKKKTP